MYTELLEGFKNYNDMIHSKLTNQINILKNMLEE